MAVGDCGASRDAGINHLSERRSGWLRSQAALSGSDRSHSQGLYSPAPWMLSRATSALFCSCSVSRTSCQCRTWYPTAVCLVWRFKEKEKSATRVKLETKSLESVAVMLPSDVKTSLKVQQVRVSNRFLIPVCGSICKPPHPFAEFQTDRPWVGRN